MILILPLITHVKLNHWINKLTASCLTQADERSREQAYEGYKSRPSPEPPPTTSGLCKQVIFFFPFLPPHFISLIFYLFSYLSSLISFLLSNLPPAIYSPYFAFLSTSLILPPLSLRSTFSTCCSILLLFLLCSISSILSDIEAPGSAKNSRQNSLYPAS